MSRISHSKPHVTEEDIEAVAEVVCSGMHSTLDKTREFESKMCRYLGVKYARAVSSGTNALHLALLSLGIGEGDEVILPSYVCQSALNALSYTRARPVLADIDPDFAEAGYNISKRTIEEKITKNTKAIVLPHMFGTPADIGPILSLDLPVIEDCAHAIGAEYKGRRVGNFGCIGIFSFYATKVISTGQGGMLTTPSKDLYNKIQDLTQYDKRERYGIAYNYNMTDFQAALGISQLSRLEDFVRRRREIGKMYNQVLFDSKIKTPRQIQGGFPFRYVIKTSSRKERDKLQERLRDREIMTERPVYLPLHKYLSLSDTKFENTEKAHDTTLSIPIYPALTQEEVGRILSALKGLP